MGNYRETQDRDLRRRGHPQADSYATRGNSANGRGQARGGEDTRRRSVGATAISPLRAAQIGIDHPAERPRRGRGQTMRTIEDQRAREIKARPAVYTADAKTGRMPPSGLVLPAWVPYALIVLALALVGVILYGPAKMFYSAWRDNGKLEARYDALTEQNEELLKEVGRLQTIEGIEDEARRRGYAFPDEEALIVDNLEEDDPTDPGKVDEAVRTHEREQPFYVNLLDQVFGYNG